MWLLLEFRHEMLNIDLLFPIVQIFINTRPSFQTFLQHGYELISGDLTPTLQFKENVIVGPPDFLGVEHVGVKSTKKHIFRNVNIEGMDSFSHD